MIKIVCIVCNNCMEELTGVIKHYNRDMKVMPILELVENGPVIPAKYEIN